MDRDRDTLNLFLSDERRVLGEAWGGQTAIPAVVISGFLGSGKTTLLKHILRNREDLRIALIINEASDIDVDSGLVGGAAQNATVGVSGVVVVGGCGCCSKQHDFRKAVRDVLALSAGNVDYLLVETTGVADPEPMADVLRDNGARLDAVVTVVSAPVAVSSLRAAQQEAGLPPGSGAAEAVQRLQLLAADIVVVNKCDLATPAELSELEDHLEAGCPRARLLRSRYCELPLEAVLSVSSSQEAVPRGQDSVGFLSHEAPDTATTKLRVVRKAAGEGGGGSQKKRKRADEGRHSNDEFGSVTFESAAPMDRAAFQEFVSHHLLKTRTVLRGKGVLWFDDARASRYDFHFSGSRCLELRGSGEWVGPPSSRLVLIGTDRTELGALRLVLGDRMSVEAGRSAAGADAEAERLAAMVAADPRFELMGVRGVRPGGGDAVGSHVVEFSLRGDDENGVDARDLNGRLARAVSSVSGLPVSTASPRTGGGLPPGHADALQWAVGGAVTPAALWTGVQEAADHIVRRAFQHVHRGCACGR